MLLAIDVGNTNSKFALYEGETLKAMWRLRTDANRTADEYALVHGRAPNAVRIAIAAGVPREAFESAMRTLADLLARPPSDLLV